MPPIELPKRAALLTGAGWSAFIVALIAVCAGAPLLNLVVPVSSGAFVGSSTGGMESSEKRSERP